MQYTGPTTYIPTAFEIHSPAPDLAGRVAQEFVGQPPDADAPLTDTEREAAIKRAGELVIAFMQEHRAASLRWQEGGNLADKGDADRQFLNAREAQRLMVELIRGRSAEQVARMEMERGLA